MKHRTKEELLARDIFLEREAWSMRSWMADEDGEYTRGRFETVREIHAEEFAPTMCQVCLGPVEQGHQLGVFYCQGAYALTPTCWYREPCVPSQEEITEHREIRFPASSRTFAVAKPDDWYARETHLVRSVAASNWPHARIRAHVQRVNEEKPQRRRRFWPLRSRHPREQV